MIDRIVNPGAGDEEPQEAELEVTLRPRDFAHYIGQERLKQNIQLAIDAATKRGEPLDHVLLHGPPGLGKTTMASVIAHEMGAQIRITSGPAIERPGDLASLLTNLQDGDILFIDEIHRLNRTVEEVLYSAMEDFKLDIMMGKGPSARSLRLDLPKFTIIGATTRTGALAAPLYLMATVVLSFAGSLGLATFLFSRLGTEGVAFNLTLLSFLFLVALGVDYNIFLMTRVREEVAVHGTREGTLRALVTTGGVVTGAGLILAGTFATLTLLPLEELIQIGATVAIGVLIDTFIVRALLIPAITYRLGERAWWPARRVGPAAPGPGTRP